MLKVTKRHLKLYFRDRLGVFFSLMSVIILILLYSLFLSKNMIDSIGDLPDAEILVNSWLFSGTIAVGSVTTTLGAFGTLVDDKARKKMRDFTVSPIKRSSLAASYIISGFLCGLVMTLLTFALSLIVLATQGAQMLSFQQIVKMLFYIVLSVAAGSSMVYLIVSFIKTNGAFSTVSTLVGTLIGFFTGMYMPIGLLPEPVQYIVKFFPPSHAGMLMRSVLMENPMKTTFENVPESVVTDFEISMGIVHKIGDFVVTPSISIAVLLGTTVVCFLLAVLITSRKKR